MRWRGRRLETGLVIVWMAALAFAVLFGWLAVRQHAAYGTQAFDLGIYDQGFWLVSRGRSFDTVRGLDFWGHHLNLISFAYAPFYWFGAGARFLLISQAVVLGVGAVPVYLIASRRLSSEAVGIVFALLYLLYAPVQWLTHANFHPEALAVTPLLFGAWYLSQRRWRAAAIAAAIAVSTREEVALILVVVGLVMMVRGRRADVEEPRRESESDPEVAGTTTAATESATKPAKTAATEPGDQPDVDNDSTGDSKPVTASVGSNVETSAAESDAGPQRRPWTERDVGMILAWVAALYYFAAIGFVIPFFNDWKPPFYFSAFYSEYGTSGFDVAANLARRPDRLVRAASQPDSRSFYADLFAPWGWFPFAAPLTLLAAVPQLIGSTIANIEYTRSIRYQYTSLLIAPIVVAAVEGLDWVRRLVVRYRPTAGRAAVWALVGWMTVSMSVASVTSSPAPWARNGDAWLRPGPWSDVVDRAIALVPDDVSVSAHYNLVPHLDHREQIYDWPNPWVEANWGMNDRDRYPDPDTVDWVVLELAILSPSERVVYVEQIEPEFDEVFHEAGVVVLRRRAASGDNPSDESK